MLAAAIAAALLMTGARKPSPPRPRAKPGTEQAVPQPVVAPTVEALPDLSHALPAKVLGKLPSTADQFRQLKGDLAKGKPEADAAKARRDSLKAEAEALRRKLIATAARVQSLEREKIVLDAQIVRLAAEDRKLSAGFLRDRVEVAQLLAVIERLQHDTPPALAMRPDDVLGAARGAMLIGASLPDVYGKAAALARRIETLKQTRAALVQRRAEALSITTELRHARVELDQLLAIKDAQAASADVTYAGLRTKLQAIAGEAANLEVLLTRVAALRTQPAQESVVVVTAQNSGGAGGRGSLLQPVVGTILPADGSAKAPGVTFAAAPGAQVVAPADCEVLFAGPYHKNGQVLILEVSVGYDLVLAGLDRIVVKPGDQVLAGEPVGVMPSGMRTDKAPQMSQDGELYFELRQNGRASSPASLLGPDLRKARRT
ncbi:MAG: peptidoglycan DD-metalloendopeptidase family protein [Rhizomicrobium sp.]